jgi:hypothetical protein
VLLDLMVIKTVASFTSRPLLWFAMLCWPLMTIGSVALIAGLFTATPDAGMSLPLTGTGIIFLGASVMLLASGTLGELIYRLGDVRPEDFARLTMKSNASHKVSS